MRVAVNLAGVATGTWSESDVRSMWRQAARYEPSMSDDRRETLLDGWRRLGRWATVFFGVYIVIWGFVYGATAMSAVGLPLNALFGGLDVKYWAMIAGVHSTVWIFAIRAALTRRARS